MRSIAATFTLLAGILAGTAMGVVDTGDTAPDFTLERYATGLNLRLYDLSGKIVVLNFFAYENAASQLASSELEPYLRQYYDARGGNAYAIPVQVVSISTNNTDMAQLSSYISTYHLDGNFVLLDTSGDVYGAYGNSILPRLAIINGVAGAERMVGATSQPVRQWEVLEAQSGYVAGNYLAFRDIIDQIKSSSTTLISLNIAGSSTVPEDGDSQYTAIATWSNGATTDVTSLATWTDYGSAYCEFDSTVKGKLDNTNHTGADKIATIKASYTFGAKTCSADKILTILDSPEPVTLVSLTITGSPFVPRNGSMQFAAMALWSNGNKTDVTADAIWNDNGSAYCQFDPGTNGKLNNTNHTGADMDVAISASYTGNGVLVGTSRTVTVLDTPALMSLDIAGPASLAEDGSGQYTATANWDDGTTTNITPLATWTSSNAMYSRFDTNSIGQLKNMNDSGLNQQVTVTASYSRGGVTCSADKAVTLEDAPELTGLLLSGQASVPVNGSTQYTATATWTDGTTENVTAGAIWTQNGPAYCAFDPLVKGKLNNTNNGTTAQLVQVTASYTIGSRNRSDSKVVTVQGQPVVVAPMVLTVKPTTCNIGSASDATSLDVTNTGDGTMSWSAEVTSGTDWLVITAGSGTNTGQIKVSYIANKGSQRVGKILVSASGASGSPVEVTIIQAEGTAPVDPVTPPVDDAAARGGCGQGLGAANTLLFLTLCAAGLSLAKWGPARRCKRR